MKKWLFLILKKLLNYLLEEKLLFQEMQIVDIIIKNLINKLEEKNIVFSKEQEKNENKEDG